MGYPSGGGWTFDLADPPLGIDLLSPDDPEWTQKELAQTDAAEREARYYGMEGLINSDGDPPGHDD